MANLAESCPGFWASDHWRACLLDGEFMDLDLGFFHRVRRGDDSATGAAQTVCFPRINRHNLHNLHNRHNRHNRLPHPHRSSSTSSAARAGPSPRPRTRPPLRPPLDPPPPAALLPSVDGSPACSPRGRSTLATRGRRSAAASRPASRTGIELGHGVQRGCSQYSAGPCPLTLLSRT